MISPSKTQLRNIVLRPTPVFMRQRKAVELGTRFRHFLEVLVCSVGSEPFNGHRFPCIHMQNKKGDV